VAAQRREVRGGEDAVGRVAGRLAWAVATGRAVPVLAVPARCAAGRRRAKPGASPGLRASADLVQRERAKGNVQGMDLEPHTLEKVGDRCEECGAKLTPQEQEVALENGGLALCAIHAAEVVPVDEELAEEE